MHFSIFSLRFKLQQVVESIFSRMSPAIMHSVLDHGCQGSDLFFSLFWTHISCGCEIKPFYNLLWKHMATRIFWKLWTTFSSGHSLPEGVKGYKSLIIFPAGNIHSFIHFDHVSLTKLHQQCQEDPHRDLKGLPDVVVVEGQDGESLFVRRRVSWMVGALVPLRGPISRRRVVSRSCSTTRRGKGNQEEQQNPRSERHARTGTPPQHSHFQTAARPNSRCSALDPAEMRLRGGREASAVRHGGARPFTHKLPRHVTHSSGNNQAAFCDKDERSAAICRHRCWLTSRVRLCTLLMILNAWWSAATQDHATCFPFPWR